MNSKHRKSILVLIGLLCTKFKIAINQLALMVCNLQKETQAEFIPAIRHHCCDVYNSPL